MRRILKGLTALAVFGLATWIATAPERPGRTSEGMAEPAPHSPPHSARRPSSQAGYRALGLIASMVLVGLLVWTAIAAAGNWRSMVLPTGKVLAGRTDDLPRAGQVDRLLKERAEVQQKRGGSPTALGPIDAAAVRQSERLLTPQPARESGSPREQVASWLATRSDNAPLLRERGFVEGVSSLPGPVSDVFQQPQGRTWRGLHNTWIVYGGGIYVLGMSLLMFLFLAWRGRVPIVEGYDGRTIERFSAFERANHWLTASSFLLMALTGLVVLYGRYLIQPWLGAGAFSWLAGWSAWTHMAFAVPFAFGLLLMIAVWARQNLFSGLDWQWINRLGGLASNRLPHPPARRFNAGQKVVFWGVVVGGLALIATGATMMLPFFWLGYSGMEWAQGLHAAIALLMIGLIIGHIYIGTVGMEGAVSAMWSGQVDRNWMKEHHSLYYEEMVREGRTGPHRGVSAKSAE